MRYVLALAASAAFLLGGSAARADLVVGFNFGQSTEVFSNTAVTITNTKVIPTTKDGGIDELADSASAPPIVVTEVAGGETFTSFTGSFSSADPLDLLTFDFGYESFSEDATFSVTIDAEGQSRTASGSLGGSGTFTETFDFEDIFFVKTGGVELQLTDAVLVDTFDLPTTDHTGFAAISGRPTVIPEPSAAGGLALLACGGAGFFVRRRIRSNRG